MNWKLARILGAAFVSLGAWESDFADDYNFDGLFLLGCSVLLAAFQAFFWLVQDILTMKRGGWKKPNLSTSLFRNISPMSTLSIALLFGMFGLMSLISSFFQGRNKAILGGWVLLAAGILYAAQAALIKLFAARFTT